MDSHQPSFRWLFGRCVFDEGSLELSVNGQRVPLERKPLEVLRHLLRHAGEVVTKDELQNAVWAGRILSETVLTKAVSRIREVLGDEGQALIKTVHGYGYRLVAAVTVEASTPQATPVLGIKAGDSLPNRPQWRLSRHLGSGSSGEVWLVEHVKTGDLRVCKFALLPESVDGLKREITLFRLLRQQLGEAAPVLEIFDWNLEDAPYFLEMRYYPAGNLQEWAEAAGGLSALALPQRLDLFVQLATALAAVHQVGVLHKDLKPANILIASTAEGRVTPMLADFGVGGVLAEDVIANAGITRLGFTKLLDAGEQGSALYMAPEVLEGQPLTLKSDLYALGVMLYQLCVGDFRKPIAPGWEQGIDDELLCHDIAAAVQGNPARRIAAATELAERIQQLDARRAARAAERQKTLLAEQSEARIKAAQLRLDRLRVRRKWMVATMAVFLAGAVTAGVFAWQAQQANRRTQAAMQFLLDDVFGGFSLKQGPAKQLTLNKLIERAAPRIDERFAEHDVANRARAYSALWNLYGISDYSTLDLKFNNWLGSEMLASMLAWFIKDPDSAYASAYRVAVEIDFWDNDPNATLLTDALADHARAHPDVPSAQRLHLAVRQAEEHIKRGALARAVTEMQAVTNELQTAAPQLLVQEPYTLFTAINNSSKLNLVGLGKNLCGQMQQSEQAAVLKDDINLGLEYLTACAVAAHTRGDSSAALKLSEQMLTLARANYDDMVGYVPTALRFIAGAQQALGRAAESMAAFDEAAEIRRKLDDGLLRYVLAGRGIALERQGLIERALADYREASDDSLETSFPMLTIEVHARYARLLAARGDAAAASTALARIDDGTVAQMPSPHRSLAAIWQAQSAIAAASKDTTTARQKLIDADQSLAQLGYPADHDWRVEIGGQLRQLPSDR